MESPILTQDDTRSACLTAVPMAVLHRLAIIVGVNGIQLVSTEYGLQRLPRLRCSQH